MKKLLRANLIGIVFLYFLFFQKLSAQITYYGCSVELQEGSGRLTSFNCGDEFIATKSDGTKWKCQCDCSNSGGSNCVQMDNGSTVLGSTNTGPTQAELDAYYNAQWSGYLYEQANTEFEKGKKSYEKGDCKKAAKQFDNARKFASHSLYDQYYELAVACRDKKNEVAVANPVSPVIKPSTTPIPTTTTTNTSSGRRMPGNINKEVLMEEKLLAANPQTWVEYQQQEFKKRIETPNAWCEKYHAELVRQDSMIKNKLDSTMKGIPSKTLSEVQAGDIILISPEKSWISKVQSKTDALLNENNAKVTHTVTCIKVVNGKRFYMDNTLGEGNRIIDEEMFKARYATRDANVAQLRGEGENWAVAQPLNKEEAKKLWDKAMELNAHNRDNVKHDLDTDKKDFSFNAFGTDYGFVNIFTDGNMVCSKSSWILLQSTGKFQIKGYEKSFLVNNTVEVSPASLFNKDQDFIISPLVYDK